MWAIMKAPLIWHYATTGGIPVRSLVVAVVVGTILNLINQGDTLLDNGPVNWLKISLTYFVPYCVSTYGAVSYRLASEEPNSRHLSPHCPHAAQHPSRDEAQPPP